MSFGRKSWKWLSNTNDKIALTTSSNNRCDVCTFRSALERTAWVQHGGANGRGRPVSWEWTQHNAQGLTPWRESPWLQKRSLCHGPTLEDCASPERQWLYPICTDRVLWSRGLHFGFRHVRPTFLYLHILLEANWAPDSWASVSCTSGPLHIPALIAWWLPGALEDVALTPLRSFSSH